MEPFRDLLSLLYFEADAQGRLTLLEGDVEVLLGSEARSWLGRRLESLWQSEPLDTTLVAMNNQVVTRGDGLRRLWLRVAVAD